MPSGNRRQGYACAIVCAVDEDVARQAAHLAEPNADESSLDAAVKSIVIGQVDNVERRTREFFGDRSWATHSKP